MTEEIARLKVWIEDAKKNIEQLPKLPLGMLLKRCSYGSLRDKIDRYKEYRIGAFGFSVHAHDTGNSTVVNLYAPDGEKLTIINRTYWYNESQYGFNKYVYLRGAWDDALTKAIDSIREDEVIYQQKKIETWEQKLSELLDNNKKTIDKFNGLFA